MEAVIPIMVEESVVKYVPLQVGKRLDIELSPLLYALSIHTTLPGLEIRKHYVSRKSKVASVVLRKNTEEAAKIRGPKEIPLKPPDKIVKQVLIVHSIHC